MFLDEARLASRCAIPTSFPRWTDLDAPELFIVMDYVHGSRCRACSSAAARRNGSGPDCLGDRVPGAARLHAGTRRRPAKTASRCCWWHRDVSPHNILVSEDGVARIVDFGIAKATTRAHQTGAASSRASSAIWRRASQLESANRPPSVRRGRRALGAAYGQAPVRADNPAAACRSAARRRSKRRASSLRGVGRVDEVVLHAL